MTSVDRALVRSAGTGHDGVVTDGEPVLGIADVRAALEAVAVPGDAAPMAAYMKDHFVFLGVKSPAQKAATKDFIASGRHATNDQILGAAAELWAQPEREFQYLACMLLRRWSGGFEHDAIDEIEQLIVTKSWWDTVDALASRTVGPMVSKHPDLVAVMDQWIEDDNMWLVRSALIHQLFYKDATDVDRLFTYAERHASHTDFFVRKAIGWALRQYSRTDATAVRAFVAAHETDLSGLSKREALKHVK